MATSTRSSAPDALGRPPTGPAPTSGEGDGRLSTLARAAFEALLIADGGVVAEANDRAAELLGYGRPEELVGRRLRDLLPEAEREGGEDAYETRLRRRDGSSFPAEVHGRPLELGGKAVRAVAIRDLTERRRAEAALRRSEARYRLLARSASDIIFQSTPDGVFTYVSPACRAMLGYEPEELVGRHTAELAHPADMERLWRFKREMFAGADALTVSFRCRRKDGTYVWIETTVRALRDPETGALQEAIGVTRDIDERKRAEEEARQREERTRLLYEITSKTALGVEAQVQETLRLTARLLGLDAGILSRIEGETCIVEAGYDALGAGLQPGQAFPLGETYCSIPLEAGDAVAVSHVERSPHRRHPCYESRGLEAYIGVPVRVRERVYGTLNFSSARPKEPPFSDVDEEFIRLLGQWVGSALERREAERALRTSEELLSGVLTSSLDGIIAFESVRDEAGQIIDFRFLHVNPRASEIVGRPAEALLGKRLLVEMPGNREEGLFDAYARVVETGEPFESMFFYDHEGIRSWFQNTAVKLGDGFTVTFRDVTESKEAERALRESEELLSGVLTSSHDGVMACQTVRGDNGEIMDFRFLHINPRAEEVFGRPAEELLGKRLLEEIPGVREEGLFDAYVRVIETGEPFHTELRYDHDNIRGWFRLTAVRLGDGITVTFSDITESKEAERRLRESEEQFRLLAEHTTDLVCLHDPDGRYRYVSPSVERVLGFRPEELVGASPYDLFHPEDAERIRSSSHAQVLRGENHAVDTYRMRTKGEGYVWLESISQVLRDESGTLEQILTSSRDVGERVEAAQMLARTNAALKQRNRELQDFAYVASHDLQEPLRKIRAFAGLLLEDYGEAVDEEGRYYLDRVQDAAGRMSTLISDLLSYSRVATQQRPFEAVDLNEALQDVLSNLEILIGEVEGRVEAGPLPAIEADGTQMRQLLQNLVGNALKFRRPEAAPVVRVEAVVEKDDAGTDVWRLSVADNGIGFDEKYLDRIFTPFQRLHSRSAYAGTGIGLAVCRRIAERHGGALTATSAPGEGSTFVAALPARHGARENEKPAS